MLSSHDFGSRAGNKLHTNDEGLIDIALEGIDVDGEPIIDIFYTSAAFDAFKLDFGGGVFAITCRDVLYCCDQNADTLRSMLSLRNTKQNNSLCQDVITICQSELRNSGFLF